jgi:hypothetical protein
LSDIAALRQSTGSHRHTLLAGNTYIVLGKRSRENNARKDQPKEASPKPSTLA